MNYKVILDNTFTSIVKTEDEVDNYYVFKTFKEAKQEALNELRDIIKNYKEAISRINELKVENLETEE